jgi:hypothetical protein
MIECRRKLLNQINLQARWRLQALGLKWISIPNKVPNANYNQWFRGPLKEWAQEILFGRRFVQRGYYNQEYIQKIFNEHQSGKDHYKRLGAIISIELWHRQFLDRVIIYQSQNY